jgi:hypothetical protein
MAAAVVQLKGVASLVVSDGNTPDLVTSQLSFLQTLLSNIVSIVANYIDSEDKYGKSSSTVESRWDHRVSLARAKCASIFYVLQRTSYGSQIILAHMVPLKVVKVFMTLKVEAVSTLKTIIFAWYGLW